MKTAVKPYRLQFSAERKKYQAVIYADGEKADWRTNPKDM